MWDFGRQKINSEWKFSGEFPVTVKKWVGMEVIMLNAALKLRSSKLTVNRTDIYDKTKHSCCYNNLKLFCFHARNLFLYRDMSSHFCVNQLWIHSPLTCIINYLLTLQATYKTVPIIYKKMLTLALTLTFDIEKMNKKNLTLTLTLTKKSQEVTKSHESHS